MLSEASNIFLLTDFGTEDHYVAVMKSVMMARCPNARFIDISHAVTPQNIAQGSYLLESAWPWLPADSTILAVVDPGVGSNREPAVFYHEEKTIIGPNNGLMGFLPSELEGRVLDKPEFWLPHVSATFHGRDIFAPCAAFIAAGGHWALLGNQPTVPVKLERELTSSPEQGLLRGQIIHFDHFGNAITNLRGGQLISTVSAEIPGKLRCPMVTTYSEVTSGSPLACVGSVGRLEIAVRNGNGQQLLGLAINDTVIIYKENPTE